MIKSLLNVSMCGLRQKIAQSISSLLVEHALRGLHSGSCVLQVYVCPTCVLHVSQDICGNKPT